MNKFDDFLRRTIKAILNDIRILKEDNCTIKTNIDAEIKKQGDKKL